jgi:hypothetical protein
MQCVGLTALVLAAAVPTQAHHSFGAEYDGNKPVTLKGVVTKIEWTNPHSHFSLDVKDEKGRTATWQLSGYTVNALYRTGWKRDVTMKVGDTVSVFGWRARDGSNSAHAREVTFADGKKLFYGPPAGTGEGGAAPAVKKP